MREVPSGQENVCQGPPKERLSRDSLPHLLHEAQLREEEGRFNPLLSSAAHVRTTPDST